MRNKQRYIVYDFGERIVLEGTEQDINKYFGSDCHSTLYYAFKQNKKEYAWYKEHRIYKLNDLGEENENL